MHPNYNKHIMKKTTILLALLPILWLGSCKNIGYEKTKTGLEYKIFSDGKGQALKVGDFVKFQYKVTYKDSLITESYGFIPGYDQVDSVGRRHDFSEVLTKLKVGDSLICIQNFDSLAAQNQFGMPPYLKKGDQQKMTIKVLAAFPDRNGAVTDYQQEIDRYKNSELTQIEKYLEQKKINAEKVNNNVYVEIQQAGTGPAADSGKLVGIKYSGYNLAGTYFDSNIDSTKQIQKHPMDPFYFIAKQEGAIVGMLDGITRFRQGGKGRIFVPSLLAYGPQGNPPAIKPNEILVFDIEVVDVKDAPVQQANPYMNMPQQQAPEQK
jgi:FKBP-type peptidyl-prolyl cis-trans isomerase